MNAPRAPYDAGDQAAVPEPVAALLAAGHALTWEPDVTGGWFALLRDSGGRLAEAGLGPSKADALAHLAERLGRRGEPGGLPAAVASDEAFRDELLDALAAVREAIDIPHAATMGDEEIRGKILHQRVMHAVIMLRSILDERGGVVPWSTAYLREQLATCPPEGYRTWDEAAAELRARKNGGTS